MCSEDFDQENANSFLLNQGRAVVKRMVENMQWYYLRRSRRETFGSILVFTLFPVLSVQKVLSS